MRENLDLSKDVLEGHSFEHYSTIENGEKALKELSEAAA